MWLLEVTAALSVLTHTAGLGLRGSWGCRAAVPGAAKPSEPLVPVSRDGWMDK